MPLVDEREEDLREAAALGNLQLVAYYLKAGVNQSKNKMNGWTPLHWACHRGHAELVRLLLSNGGDANIQNTKGETPKDLARTNTVKALLNIPTNNAEAPAFVDDIRGRLGVVPHFIVEPDLNKLWGMPNDTASLPVPAPEQRERSQPAVLSSTTAENNPTAANSTREVLVYNGSSPPISLLGVVIVSPNMTVLNVLTMVKEEIGYDPQFYNICKFRIGDKTMIPISEKQYVRLFSDFFRTDNDALMLC